MRIYENIHAACKLLEKYGDPDLVTDHDRVWAGPNNTDEVSTDDATALKLLGWYDDGTRWGRDV